MDIPAQGNALQGATQAPQGAPMAVPSGGGNPLIQGAPGAAPGQPAPTHDMTATTLHHLSEMQRQFTALLKNPGTGKQDMKGAMLDSLADLMSEGLLDAPKSVSMIQMFPEQPEAQKQWLEQSLAMMRQAQAKILADHRASTPGTGIFAVEAERHHKRGGGHGETLTGVINHYKPKGR